MESLVVRMVISFVMSQLHKLNGKLDWQMIKSQVDEHVRAMVPGTWFDDQACAFVDSTLAALQAVLQEEEAIKQVLMLVAAQKYSEVMALLKGLLGGYLSRPAFAYSDADMKVYQAVSMV